ncbi:MULTISPECIES: hypothetical protein [Acinetobacter calcoaceticus/baumannii complex]|jgi:hypothetical protein|uniref:Uncharacterized protein n=1 Tax=Acinetobacter pittii TaxID=48296 RepID=A0A6S4UP75_ACIPI|nr:MULTISPECIES: hypothetical protein [Acinetobacter calcoaceticus/baumannii complex]MDA3593900.1 hypothetical protein [Acinetobacter baumannii]MDA4946992.1 hypothetical protein [Acinetobacter baumannii]OCZ48967.1 hypothetical protein BFR73_02255 [Acinetobacter pittii]BBQ50141.1 hypothetical protein WP2W18E11_31390 [Acinetobacter pittii]
MHFQSVRQSFDEYVLRFDSFPDLIFMGRNYFYDFFNEVNNLKKLYDVDNWKVLNDPKNKNYEILGCKVIIVNDELYSFGFFEFEDLEKAKEYIIDKNYRNSHYRLSLQKCRNDIDHKSWDPVPPTEPRTNFIINIPFFVIEAFKLEQLSKKEIEDRKDNYKLRKGIYEPETRF